MQSSYSFQKLYHLYANLVYCECDQIRANRLWNALIRSIIFCY